MSHNIKTLQNLPTGHLKKLHAKYSNKKTEEASREAKTIKGILKSRMHEHYKQELYNSLDESFASAARDFARSRIGATVMSAALANPVGGVHTLRGTPGMRLPGGSTESITSRSDETESRVIEIDVPTINLVSTRPEPAVAGTQEQKVIGHGTFQFTGEAHPKHGTPKLKNGQIKPGSDTFKVNTATGETHRLNADSTWSPVSHVGYVAPSRDQIEQRSIPGSPTHISIQKAKAQDTVIPATTGSPAVPSRLVGIPGSKKVTSIIPGRSFIVTTTNVSQNPDIMVDGLPTRPILAPRTDEYTDTSNMQIPLHGVRRRRSNSSTQTQTNTTTPDSSGIPSTPPRRSPSTPPWTTPPWTTPPSTPPWTPPTPPPTPPKKMVRGYRPGRVATSGSRVAYNIGGTPVFAKPLQGPMVPANPRRPGPRPVGLKDHFELKNFYTNILRENIIKCSDT